MKTAKAPSRAHGELAVTNQRFRVLCALEAGKVTRTERVPGFPKFTAAGGSTVTGVMETLLASGWVELVDGQPRLTDMGRTAVGALFAPRRRRTR